MLENEATEEQRRTAMADLTGSEILARSLKNEGTKEFFFIMGGPMRRKACGRITVFIV